MRGSTDLTFRDNPANQVIYPPTKVSWYLWLLVISKFFYCIGTFVTYDALKHVHVVHFLLLVMLICSAIHGLVQRPLSAGKRLERSTYIKLGQYAVAQTLIKLLWLYGIFCIGPLRSTLLFAHSDIAILAVLAAILKGNGGSDKIRGSFWFVIGVLSLILFDNDLARPPEHAEGQQHHGIKHLLYYALSWTGLSHHEGGIVMLLLTVILRANLSKYGQQLSIDLGGARRLHALTSIASVALLLPLSLIISLTQESSQSGILKFIPQAFVVALFVFTLHYYIESACKNRLDPVRTLRIGSFLTFMLTFIISFVWPTSSPLSDDLAKEHLYGTDHKISGGVVFALFMFTAATLQLTSVKDRWRGTMIGQEGTTEVLPLHGLPSEALHRSQSLINFITSTLNHIHGDRNSRTIFYFLCLNLGFTCVELIYGMWTNSLGLISDGFHMLFDCSALVMGLCASMMAHWKPTKTFPFGYGRIEVLSGFANGLFLTVIGSMVLIESIGRMVEPPNIHTEKLLLVAVCGLIINLFGIFSFSHSHSISHSHSQCQTSGHSHPLPHSHGHSHNANMQGVFLHIVADTLGSVAVIISSLLIEWYGWLIADPICSFILAILILTSVIPLLRDSVTVLLLRVPNGYEQNIKDVINKILALESIVNCQDPHFWQHTGDIYVASVTIQCSGEVPEQRLIHQVTYLLQEIGFNQTTVQVEVIANKSAVNNLADTTTSQSSNRKVSFNTTCSPSLWGLGTIIRTSECHPGNVHQI